MPSPAPHRSRAVGSSCKLLTEMCDLCRGLIVQRPPIDSGCAGAVVAGNALLGERQEGFLAQQAVKPVETVVRVKLCQFCQMSEFLDNIRHEV